MNIRNVILAEQSPLPLEGLAYQYVLAANGLWVRAEDSRIDAQISVADADIHGLWGLAPHARLKMPRVPAALLAAILRSAYQKLPNEAMYQLRYENGAWRCAYPPQAGTPASLQYTDRPETVIDLHSHGSLAAFFSTTDDEDEKGFRFYGVLGKVNTRLPQIECRIGVYGHTWPVPFDWIFEDDGSLIDVSAIPDAEALADKETTDAEEIFAKA